MDTHAAPCTASLTAARLLIHAEDQRSHIGPRFDSALHRLRARYSSGRQHELRLPLKLQVDDLQGQRLGAIDDAGPLTDLPLPAGTYRITAIRGDLRRSYTLTLEPGASFELYLRLAVERT